MIKKYTRLGGWNKFIVSLFWRLEAQDLVDSNGFYRSLSSWLVDNHLLPVPSDGLPLSVCVLISPPYKDTINIGLRSILISSFYLHDLIKDSFQMQSYPEMLGVMVSAHKFGEGHNSVHSSLPLDLSPVIESELWFSGTHSGRDWYLDFNI